MVDKIEEVNDPTSNFDVFSLHLERHAAVRPLRAGFLTPVPHFSAHPEPFLLSPFWPFCHGNDTQLIPQKVIKAKTNVRSCLRGGCQQERHAQPDLVLDAPFGQGLTLQ